MPKKTKREKILAEYRRKIKLIKKDVSSYQKPKVISAHKVNITQETSTKQANTSITYFYRDLRKSLFFIIVIILFEVLLYVVKI